MKHPTILPVGAAYSGFVFEVLSARDARAPLVDDTREIIRVNPGCPVPTLYITERTAHIFQPRPIKVIEVCKEQIPGVYFVFRISHRETADLEPSINAISASTTMLNVIDLSRFD